MNPRAARAIGSVLVAARDLARAGSRRVRRPTVREATVLVAIFGVVWLVLEFALRGGDAPITVDWKIVAGVAAMGAFIGLAARARMSVRGELSVGGEFVTFVLLVVSILPAVMLLVYGVAFIASAGLVSVSWLTLGIALVLAVLLQLAVYAGLVAAFVSLVPAEIVAAIVVSVAYVLLASAIGTWISGEWTNAWNFELMRWTHAHREMIPEWTFVVQGLRRSLAPLDHGRLLSVVSSIAAGAGIGLVVSLLLRFTRQRLMQRVSLRGWLPMAAAPVPDSISLVDRSMVAPLVVYSLVGWTVLLLWKVL
jgi:hypothetical protein